MKKTEVAVWAAVVAAGGAAKYWDHKGRPIPWKLELANIKRLRRKEENEHIRMTEAMLTYSSRNEDCVDREVLADLIVEAAGIMQDNDAMGVWTALFPRRHMWTVGYGDEEELTYELDDEEDD